jgi:hypothetical protein
MEKLIDKLNFKNQSEILLINLPEELVLLKECFKKLTTINESIKKIEKISFGIFFVTQQQQIDSIAQQIQSKIQGDAIIWFAYPKGTSKKYKCDFNRDTGWQTLGNIGLEGVRMVAIDENWTALRFRKVEFIKTMKRNEKMTISTEGKKKIATHKEK